MLLFYRKLSKNALATGNQKTAVVVNRSHPNKCKDGSLHPKKNPPVWAVFIKRQGPYIFFFPLLLSYRNQMELTLIFID